MAFDFELPPELKAKLETAAHLYGETPEHMVLLAIAEKLARLEHEEWLTAAKEARKAVGKSTTDTLAAADVAAYAEARREEKHPEE